MTGPGHRCFGHVRWGVPTVVASFHCTLYPVTAEPPLLSGASQETSSFPVSFTDTLRLPGDPGTVAATAVVVALVRVSSFPPSSVKVTFTLMVLPESESNST